MPTHSVGRGGEALRTAGRLLRGVSTPGAGGRVLRDDARILVLQIQQLGDTLAASGVVRAVSRRYPGASIDVLASPVAAGVYARSSHVRRIHTVARSTHALGRALAWARAIRVARRERYDCVLACTNHVSVRHGLLAWLTGAPERVGFDRGGRGFFFTVRLPVRTERSCYEENMDLARAVDCLFGASEGEPADIAFDGSDERQVAALLVAHHIPAGRPLVVLHPGANWQSKTWYAERWSTVADALAVDGYHPVFVGVASEAPLVQSIRLAMQQTSASLLGCITVPELAALLTQAALFVGTDSGPRHVAAAVGCLQVTIMSAQDVVTRWRIPGARETILRSEPPCAGCLQSSCSHRRCMNGIGADAVVRACREARAGERAVWRPNVPVIQGVR